jgi:hypothetical protein
LTPKHPILGTSSDAFVLSFSLKFPKSMVQFFKFLQNDFGKFTLYLLLNFLLLKDWIANILKFFIKSFLRLAKF